MWEPKASGERGGGGGGVEVSIGEERIQKTTESSIGTQGKKTDVDFWPKTKKEVVPFCWDEEEPKGGRKKQSRGQGAITGGCDQTKGEER